MWQRPDTVREQGGDEIFRDSLDSLTDLTVNGSADDDTLIVDFSGGTPPAGTVMTFNGGDQSTAGDVLIGISGSGNSENVLRAVEYANGIGCKTIGLTTSTGGRLKDLAQRPLAIPSDHMGRLEDAFFILTHIMCYAFIEKAF